MAHVLRQKLVVRGEELAFFRRQLPLQVRGDDGPAGFPAQFPDLVEAVLAFGRGVELKKEGGGKEGGGKRDR